MIYKEVEGKNPKVLSCTFLYHGQKLQVTPSDFFVSNKRWTCPTFRWSRGFTVIEIWPLDQMLGTQQKTNKNGEWVESLMTREPWKTDWTLSRGWNLLFPSWRELWHFEGRPPLAIRLHNSRDEWIISADRSSTGGGLEWTRHWLLIVGDVRTRPKMTHPMTCWSRTN